MQIDMDIEPVPTTYSWLTKTSPNQWKVNKLSTLQKNELSLLRGEVINDMVGEPQPLTSSAKAKLEKRTKSSSRSCRPTRRLSTRTASWGCWIPPPAI